ncbi:MAG: hypothetical protein ACXAE3_01570 [Candidatus Kariarchaeaceae archaeon]|jgi:hypothetical protein
MKKLTSLLLAVFFMTVLMTGQTAVIASINMNAISVDGYDDSAAEYGVSIARIGPDAINNFTLDADGTYHYVTDSPVPFVRFDVDFSGYTVFDRTIGNSTDSETVSMPYGGTLMVAVNGELNTVGLTDLQFPVKTGVNVITVLYIYKNTDGTTDFVSDTAVVRVAATDAFAALSMVEIPLTSTVTDSAGGQLNISGMIAYEDFFGGASLYYENFDPAVDLDVTLTSADTDSTITADGDVVIGVVNADAPGTLAISGTVDSSGYNGPQQDSYQLADGGLRDASTGLNIVMDAHGVHHLDDADHVSVFTTGDDSTTQTAVSVATIADYGYMDWEATVEIPAAISVDFDWEQLFGIDSLDGDALPATVGLVTDDNVYDQFGFNRSGMWGSYDFVQSSFTINIRAAGASGVVTETITGDTPGFGLLASLMAAASVAYVVPRLRKD